MYIQFSRISRFMAKKLKNFPFRNISTSSIITIQFFERICPFKLTSLERKKISSFLLRRKEEIRLVNAEESWRRHATLNADSVTAKVASSGVNKARVLGV